MNCLTNKLNTSLWTGDAVTKIMTVILVKNISIGLYKGISNFTKSSRPVTQIWENLSLYTVQGVFEAIFWPVTLPYMLTYELDKVALYLMNKNNQS